MIHTKHRKLWLFLLYGVVVVFLSSFSSGWANQTSDGDPQQVFIPMVYKDYDPTWQWEPLKEVTLTPTPYSTTTAIDLNGKPHIFWDTWGGSNAFIYHRYQTEGGWSDPEAIAQTLGTSDLLAPPVAGERWLGSHHLEE